MDFRGPDAGTIRRTDDHRHTVPSHRSHPDPGDVRHDLFIGRVDEAEKLNLDDRFKAIDGKTDRRTDDAGFTERCIDDPVFPELFL